MYTKFIIVTDDDVNTRGWKEVIWAITTRVDLGRDTLIVENTPIDDRRLARFDQFELSESGINIHLPRYQNSSFKLEIDVHAGITLLTRRAKSGLKLKSAPALCTWKACR